MANRRAFVELQRGDVVESRHSVSAALVDTQGQLMAWVGDPELLTYFRSAAKPFQALPLVDDGAADAFGFSETELAICCASHSGEPAHVRTVRSILSRIGCGEEDLECGAHPPFHQPSAEALRAEGRAPSCIHNNCSGKHSGMLAWARHAGEETVGYPRADHPVQRRIRREIARWTGNPADELGTAIDGCGVITYAQPLNSMATAFARLVAAADHDSGSPASRVTRAMTGEPYYVAGTGRLSTQLMETTDGRILAKGGAEGIFCAGDSVGGWGLALKVEDGRKRGVGPAVIEFMAQAELLDESELSRLEDHHVWSLTNTRGEIVGMIRPAFRIERSG